MKYKHVSKEAFRAMETLQKLGFSFEISTEAPGVRRITAPAGFDQRAVAALLELGRECAHSYYGYLPEIYFNEWHTFKLVGGPGDGQTRCHHRNTLRKHLMTWFVSQGRWAAYQPDVDAGVAHFVGFASTERKAKLGQFDVPKGA